MGKPSKFATMLANRLDESLLAICILSEILINNGGYKADPGDMDNPPQIDDRGESGVQSAIKIIAEMAHRDLCELSTDLEIPYE
ncbi:hypothetical protein [Pseudomonas chlororaphis]|uniref:Phage protein n=1 Tax=Pseudomonas chlororaphis O6 TaxID=1037915 RepID=A0AB33WST7_9PSED|nr:hypothetical protein [Pseudomonas chlororaphis]EIM16174.1 hypothetical protein PchlO6_1217 [Pseudomonas chlororaphis O6]